MYGLKRWFYFVCTVPVRDVGRSGPVSEYDGGRIVSGVYAPRHFWFRDRLTDIMRFRLYQFTTAFPLRFVGAPGVAPVPALVYGYAPISQAPEDGRVRHPVPQA